MSFNLLCVLTGHKWTLSEATNEPGVQMVCQRCGQRHVQFPEQHIDDLEEKLKELGGGGGGSPGDAGARSPDRRSVEAGRNNTHDVGSTRQHRFLVVQFARSLPRVERDVLPSNRPEYRVIRELHPSTGAGYVERSLSIARARRRIASRNPSV
jgi:hypothetical protein